jgi:hypothetical protein
MFAADFQIAEHGQAWITSIKRTPALRVVQILSAPGTQASAVFKT